MIKRGRVRVIYDSKDQIWKIQGKVIHGVWVDVSDGDKDLCFDLEYDACAFFLTLFDDEDCDPVLSPPKYRMGTRNKGNSTKKYVERERNKKRDKKIKKTRKQNRRKKK